LNTRRVARELALLTLAQLRVLPPGARPSMSELVVQAAASLAQEAREHLKAAGASVARAHTFFARLGAEGLGPELLHEIVRLSIRDERREQLDEVSLDTVARAFWRRAKSEEALTILEETSLEVVVPEALKGLEELREAIELVGAALEWPAIAAGAESEAVTSFTLRLVDHYWRDREAIDQLLEGATANWSIERMASLDRDVLRLAVAEIKHDPDVPVEVAINEAVELAKKYGSEESGKFVNGVLGAIARDTQRIRTR